MEKHVDSAVIPLDLIRGLIVLQKGRCAITGIPLNPLEVNGDHIIPLSRTNLNPSHGSNNLWLVHKSVNSMKGTMTYDELVHMAKTIIAHENITRQLLEQINKGDINPQSKKIFDEWVSENCSEDGTVKSELR